ncbi:MAG: metallophosphoesterase [Bacteroidota bacterium]|nr:metallophosphoesterase [Bacteroidota bacterium]
MHRLLFGIVAIGLVLSIYFGFCYYIFLRGWQALPKISLLRSLYIAIFLLLVLSFFAGMIFEHQLPFKVSGDLQVIGVSWMISMVYIFIFLIFFDLLRLANHFWGIFPAIITAHYLKVKIMAFIIVLASIIIAFFIGYLRFSNPQTTVLQLSIPKHAGELKELKIAVASDLHLGDVVRKERLKKFVGKIEGLHPDMILLAGDVIDRNIKPVVQQNMSEELRKLKAPLGVYAITGNHEHYGNVEKSCAYLQQSGITVLRDTAIKIKNSLYLIGRDDLSNKHRQSLHHLTENLDPALPLILLDHQPRNLKEAISNHIDLQLSGHTHDGQVWPFNLIIHSIYEDGYGYLRKDNTQFYVTSGLGLWGAPFRIGTKSEVVLIKLRFK